MMKKIICGFLTLIMLVGATITAFAQVSQGHIGYSADRVDRNAYAGVDAIDIENIEDNTDLVTTLKQYDYFCIDSVEGMKWFGEIVSRGTSTEVSEEEPYSFFGKTVFLKNDIDFKGVNMLPIGEDGNREGEPDGIQLHVMYKNKGYFAGTFDGQGYSVKNLNMSPQVENARGTGIALFKGIRGGAVIKNLVIDSTCFFTNQNSQLIEAGTGRSNVVSSLVCYAVAANGSLRYDNDNAYYLNDISGYTIDNVISYASLVGGVTVSDDYRHDVVGGLVGASMTNGSLSSAILNSTFEGNIASAGYCAGGILGLATEESNLFITNCRSSGDIGTTTAPKYAGGIIGEDNARNVFCTILGCMVDDISISASSASGAYVGCNARNTSVYKIKNCINKNAELQDYGSKVGSFTENIADSETVPEYYGYQTGMSTTVIGDKHYRSVRIIGTLTEQELELYSQVGFYITVSYNDTGRFISSESDTVYESLMATTDDATLESIHAPDGKFFFAVILENIPVSLGTLNFTVTPCAKSSSGEKTIYGAGESVIIDLAQNEDERFDTDGVTADGSWFDSFKKADYWEPTLSSLSIEDGAMKISASATLSTYTVLRDVNLNENNFVAETRLKIAEFGANNGFYVNYGGKRIAVFIYENKICINNTYYIYSDIGNDWHTYKVIANDDIASIYVDGRFIMSVETVSHTSKRGFAFFGALNSYIKSSEMYVDYARYTPLTTDITVNISGNTITTCSGAQIYLDGMLAGFADEQGTLNLTGLGAGVHRVYAMSDNAISSECVFTVEGQSQTMPDTSVEFDAEQLPSSYIIDYTVNGTGTLSAGDGIFKLLKQYAETDNGSYRAVVDGGVYWIYKDGKLTESDVLTYGDCDVTNALAAGGVSIDEVVAYNKTLFRSESSENDAYLNIGYDYAFEFEYVKGSNASIRVSDGAYLIAMQIDESGEVRAMNALTGTTVGLKTLFDVGDSKAYYRVYVSSGIAQIYVNNKWVSALRLPSTLAEAHIYTSGEGIGLVQIRQTDDSKNAPTLTPDADMTLAGNHTVAVVQIGSDIYVCGETATLYKYDETQSEYVDVSTSEENFNNNVSFNTIVLNSGNILSVMKVNDHYVGFVFDANKNFEYRADLNTDSDVYRATMNGKLMQTTLGRIIFVCGETATETKGQMAVYYSDDDGETWSVLKAFSNTVTGLNLQEGCVVELEGEKLRFYARSDTGFLYYADSDDNGANWTEFKPSEFTSVLSAFNVTRDKYSGYLYMVWEYDNTVFNADFRYPRSREALAVSTDNGESWKYVCDMDNVENAKGDTNAHMNLGVWITDDYVYVTMAMKATSDYNRMIRIAKSDIVPMARFAGLKSLGNAVRNDYAAGYDLSGVMVISSDSSKVYAAGKLYDVKAGNGAEATLSLESVSAFLSGNSNYTPKEMTAKELAKMVDMSIYSTTSGAVIICSAKDYANIEYLVALAGLI